MSKKIGLDIIPTDSVYSAIKSADIIVTATTSSKPVIKGKWLGEGVHINAVGSFYPNHRELDTETILKSKVIVDLKDAALKEAGDILIPIKEGKINKEYIYGELGEIIIGKKTGRINNNEITIFKSVGLAVQDAAIANLILKNYYKTLTSKN
jgi:ornithine cyclodeaminase/alanine dehydrogenase